MAKPINIFQFLKEFNQIRNPVIREIDKQKWSLNLKGLPKINELQSVFESGDNEESVLMRIRKPIINPCPSPNKEIEEWIDGDWQNLRTKHITYKDEIIRYKDDLASSSGYKIRFKENSQRLVLFNQWILARNNWLKKESEKIEVLEIYNKVFQLYSDMKKEAESIELMVGDGILTCRTETGTINHPLLLQSVKLEFNPEIPEFIIECEDFNPELYTALLRTISSINQTMLSEVISEIESSFYAIADYLNTHPLYKRLVNLIDKSGTFNEIEKPITGKFSIHSSPVLFLRNRTLGYSAFIEGIIKEISEKGDQILPGFFQNMVGNFQENTLNEIIDDSWTENGIDQDILLTLPSNNEQLKIIKYLDKYGAVLVQGPPGTGKTHTIANLIGHLLSQGSSVLVTSHTEKALTVLKDKVYKDKNNSDLNLQNLCISLLSSKSQKKEMDEAINQLAIKGTQLDINEANRKIVKLENERKALIDKSMNIRKELIRVRSLEYADIVYDNHTISPIEAAKFINCGLGYIDYIEGDTCENTIGLPVSINDLIFLYKSNDSIESNEEILLTNVYPNIDNLIKPDLLEEKYNSLKEYKDYIIENKPVFKIINDINNDCLNSLISNFRNINSDINSFDDINKSFINKGIKDKVYIKIWSDTINEYEQFILVYEEFRKIQLEDEYIFHIDTNWEEIQIVLKEIADSGKKNPLSRITLFTKPLWKKSLQKITKNGKSIIDMNDLSSLSVFADYNVRKNKLIYKMNKLIKEINYKEELDGINFERNSNRLIKNINKSIKWLADSWGNILNDFEVILLDDGFIDKLFETDEESHLSNIMNIIQKEIIPSLDYHIKNMNYINLKKSIDEYIDYLRKYKDSNPIIKKLVHSLVSKCIVSYKETYDFIIRSTEKIQVFNRRKDILDNIRTHAPAWADSIEQRNGIHGNNILPERIEDAWKWRQLSNQLKSIDDKDPNILNEQLHEINNQLIRNAQLLAFEKAWFEKIRAITLEQTQAIEGWRTTIKQIGKGKGKKAPELLRKARELMPKCQSAIPVWIMPINKVVENFNPDSNKFDVVIVDEASQSDILSLAALYLGKKIIIVGDDEQVSPESVGLNSDEITNLGLQYLQGVPNMHLYNGLISLYDIAKASGFKPLMLSEHFRCLPEIIEFSNNLSYNGRIRPLRDAANVQLGPAVVEHRVVDGVRNFNKINSEEAEHIASMICACIEMDEYKDKTIGVISLLGAEQSTFIDKILQNELDPTEYEKRRIQCGTPPQFQGDERDIIFLSIVEGPSEKGGPVRLVAEDGYNEKYRKRYNVAASRAKDQMWVVHSLNPSIDLKPDDIRLRLINHAINPMATRESSIVSQTESPFEKEVYNILHGKGYKVTPQVKVGSYRIDMVVGNDFNKIALECDGERWHTRDNLTDDLKRQAILERLGWRFIRIRGRDFYSNPERTMEIVLDKLNSFNIKPDFSSESIGVNSQDLYEKLLIKVKQRANEIKKEWNENKRNNNIPTEINKTKSSVKNEHDNQSLLKDEDNQKKYEVIENEEDTTKAGYIDDVVSGDYIKHKSFGKGKVVKIENDYIFIDFGIFTKMFMYPSSIDLGIIQIEPR